MFYEEGPAPFRVRSQVDMKKLCNRVRDARASGIIFLFFHVFPFLHILDWKISQLKTREPPLWNSRASASKLSRAWLRSRFAHPSRDAWSFHTSPQRASKKQGRIKSAFLEYQQNRMQSANSISLNTAAFQAKSFQHLLELIQI